MVLSTCYTFLKHSLLFLECAFFYPSCKSKPCKEGVWSSQAPSLRRLPSAQQPGPRPGRWPCPLRLSRTLSCPWRARLSPGPGLDNPAAPALGVPAGSLLILFEGFLTKALIEQVIGSPLKSLLLAANVIPFLFLALFTFCSMWNFVATELDRRAGDVQVSEAGPGFHMQAFLFVGHQPSLALCQQALTASPPGVGHCARC